MFDKDFLKQALATVVGGVILFIVMKLIRRK